MKGINFTSDISIFVNVKMIIVFSKEQFVNVQSMCCENVIPSIYDELPQKIILYKSKE